MHVKGCYTGFYRIFSLGEKIGSIGGQWAAVVVAVMWGESGGMPPEYIYF